VPRATVFEERVSCYHAQTAWVWGCRILKISDARECLSSLLQGIVRGVPARIPSVLFALFVIFVVRRSGDQIATLFDDLMFPGGDLGLIMIVMAVGLALVVLGNKQSWCTWAVDSTLASIPLLALLWNLTGPAPQEILLAAIALSVWGMALWLAYRLPEPTWRRLTGLAAGCIAIWLAVFLAIEGNPIAFPRALGSLAITFIFVGLCVILIRIALGAPWLGLPTLVVLTLIFFCDERPHIINQPEPASKVLTAFDEPGREEASLQQAFNIWLASRNDLEEYRGRRNPYPVFLVASEGGGGYAAAHAYLFLSKLQQRCPNFAGHVFALVGVSGGAVGNTMFRSALPAQVNHDRYRGCADVPTKSNEASLIDSVAADNLSPVVAAMLFRDMPNRLLFGFLGPQDRADALVDSIVDAVGSPTANPAYWDHFWSQSKDGGLQLGESPAVIEVATNAVSGRRYVFAPFRFSDPSDRFENSLADFNWTDRGGKRKLSDVSLFDAAVASASFPWLTPSRLILGKRNDRIALVDGGYIDNSGAETVRDILAELQSPNVDFTGATVFGDWRRPNSSRHDARTANCHLLRIETVSRNNDPEKPLYAADGPADDCRVLIELHVVLIRAKPSDDRHAKQQSFFRDPAIAMMSARARRGDTARYGLLSQMCGAPTCSSEQEWATQLGIYESVIDTDDLTLPLGWKIRRNALVRLSKAVVPLGKAQFPDSRPLWGTMETNGLSLNAITAALDPQTR
jgi:hypothetical protein